MIFDRRPTTRKAGRRTEAKIRKTRSGRRVTVIRPCGVPVFKTTLAVLDLERAREGRGGQG